MAAIKRRVRSPHVLSVCVAQVPSDGLLGASLPVTMFYVKNSTDFLGRCFTLLPLCIKSQKVNNLSQATHCTTPCTTQQL